jgi:hypothetical protein
MSQNFVAVSCEFFEDAEADMMAREGTLFDEKERREWRTTLEKISQKVPLSCDEAYSRYALLPIIEQKQAKKAAQNFVGESGAQNFDDALVWLACFDFDETAMKNAIRTWLGGQQ